MREISYTYLHPTGGDSPASEDLANFLVQLPGLFQFGYVPPLRYINGYLKKGEANAGMSGGAAWEPFELGADEFNSLITELGARAWIDSKPYDFSLLDTAVLSDIQWEAKVMERKYRIPYEQHLQLLEREKKLKQISESSVDEEDEELKLQRHLDWYKAATELMEFCDDYIQKAERN